jgi:hypothetical protein
MVINLNDAYKLSDVCIGTGATANVYQGTLGDKQVAVKIINRQKLIELD